jgi:hypothetical protein
MKRHSKCVNKKPFVYRDEALTVAKKMFLNQGIKSAIYECPACLDFHLTTKWCNTRSYHQRWLREKKPKVTTIKKPKKLPPPGKKYPILPRDKQVVVFKHIHNKPAGPWLRFKDWARGIMKAL